MLRSVSVFSRIPSPVFSRVQVAKMSIDAGPLIPKLMPLERSGMTSSAKSEGQRFSVVSHNILAQVYVKSALFPHSPASCLRWKARSEAILSLLKSFGTDFLCLQEVDEYDTFYKGKMEIHGYSSIYVKRSGKKRDGCGIFYKHTSAELLLQETIEYNDLINSISGVSETSIEINGNDNGVETEEDGNDPRVRLKRDNVGIMGAFKLKGHSDHYLIVANTHLYWDPDWADVKLAQAKYLLSRLARFKMSIAEKFNCKPSLIVTGDFNSTPGDKVYEEMKSGSLVSLYAETKGGEPAFTNCTPGFTGTLDYIFFTPSGVIEPVSLLELPEHGSPSVAGGLPNLHHPSDHLPIGAEFQF